jgi:hypothetical protein
MRFFVLSDLHAYSDLPPTEGQPSFLALDRDGNIRGGVTQNPILDLEKCITTNSIKADYLICCGDLAHRADQVGLRYAWRFLNSLEKHLGVKATLATIGNHDVDSRFKDAEANPFDGLKSLDPRFPFQDDHLFDRFWSRNFAIYQNPEARFLVINSCSVHGYTEEYQRGYISNWTLAEIERQLSASSPAPINIAIVHHHPHRHTELDLGDTDDIKGGDAFMHLLGRSEFGNWLILHGHKHHPKLCYAKGDSFSPTVFSAGSFSARLQDPVAKKACNQFYLIDIDPGAVASAGRLQGRFQTWSWSMVDGWINDNFRGLGLPPSGGFGHRDGAGVAQRIIRLVRGGTTARQQLITELPDLAYVIPSEIEKVLGICRAGGIRFSEEKPLPANFEA